MTIYRPTICSHRLYYFFLNNVDDVSHLVVFALLYVCIFFFKCVLWLMCFLVCRPVETAKQTVRKQIHQLLQTPTFHGGSSCSSSLNLSYDTNKGASVCFVQASRSTNHPVYVSDTEVENQSVFLANMSSGEI